LLPDRTAIEEDAAAPELPVALDMPGKVADFLCATELDDVERAAGPVGVLRRNRGPEQCRQEPPLLFLPRRLPVQLPNVRVLASQCGSPRLRPNGAADTIGS
ncbi:hypothetical protein ACPCKX_33495, partial [Streptomyces lavendulocolor]